VLVANVPYETKIPCFTLIVLSDDAYVAVALDERKPINLSHRHSPLLLFIGLLNHAIQLVCESWGEVIRKLDTELGVKVRGIQQSARV
jgi:hypothetical protein